MVERILGKNEVVSSILTVGLKVGQPYGEMAEWFKATVSKTADIRKVARKIESPSLLLSLHLIRQIP